MVPVLSDVLESGPVDRSGSVPCTTARPRRRGLVHTTDGLVADLLTDLILGRHCECEMKWMNLRTELS